MSQQTEPPDREADDAPHLDRPTPDRILRAEELFGPSREVWIDLDGVRYRLRITRRGKLILQK